MEEYSDGQIASHDCRRSQEGIEKNLQFNHINRVNSHNIVCNHIDFSEENLQAPWEILIIFFMLVFFKQRAVFIGSHVFVEKAFFD